MSGPGIVVTGTGLALPGPDGAPVDPAAVLGRRGLRYKDRATLLALCAVTRAVADAGRPAAGEDPERATTGVVLACELGNLDTICRVVDDLGSGGAAATAPMDLPNASPNSASAAVGIRFGFGALNVLVTSGRSGGADALALAVTALRAGRADRIVLVGAEPDTPAARAVLAAQAHRAGRPAPDRVVDGAAAVVLEPAARAAARGARVRAAVAPAGSAARTADLVAGESAPDLWLPPEPSDADLFPGAAVVDPAAGRGDPVGAHGVLQLAAAAAWLDEHPGATALAVCGRERVAGVRLAGRAVAGGAVVGATPAAPAGAGARGA